MLLDQPCYFLMNHIYQMLNKSKCTPSSHKCLAFTYQPVLMLGLAEYTLVAWTCRVYLGCVLRNNFLCRGGESVLLCLTCRWWMSRTSSTSASRWRSTRRSRFPWCLWRVEMDVALTQQKQGRSKDRAGKAVMAWSTLSFTLALADMWWQRVHRVTNVAVVGWWPSSMPPSFRWVHGVFFFPSPLALCTMFAEYFPLLFLSPWLYVGVIVGVLAEYFPLLCLSILQQKILQHLYCLHKNTDVGVSYITWSRCSNLHQWITCTSTPCIHVRAWSA
jgi:hypothetical protein